MKAQINIINKMFLKNPRCVFLSYFGFVPYVLSLQISVTLIFVLLLFQWKKTSLFHKDTEENIVYSLLIWE